MGGLTENHALRDGLRIDADITTRHAEHFVNDWVTRMNKRGVILGLSGGLDSSVCAFLCQRALGAERVHAFILPERDSDPRNMQDAQLVADTLGLHATRIDISPLLEQLGVYDLLSEEQANNRDAIETGIRWISRVTRTPSAFSTGIAVLSGAQPNRWARLVHRLLWRATGRVHAFTTTKVRLRMVMLYHQAALNDCLVVGTTDKSEYTIGFYDRYGDGASDITLLRHLYKTQIRELARHLGVPERIVSKPSSGDLAGGVPNEVLIGLSYEQLDAVLWGLERGMDERDIVAQADISPAALEAIQKAMGAAQAVRALPAHL